MAEPIDKDEYHNQEYIADMDLIGMMTKEEEQQNARAGRSGNESVV